MARRSRTSRRLFLPFTPQGEATELQAIRVKERLGLRSDAAVDPYDVLERVPARLLDPEDFRRDVPPVASKLFIHYADEWSAVVLGHSPTTDEALILVNPTHHVHRQRVSLMEEVVHVVLEHPKTEITRSTTSGAVWVRSYDEGVEGEAYSVGAACILPWPELFDAVSRRSETIVEIAARYQVSEAYAPPGDGVMWASIRIAAGTVGNSADTVRVLKCPVTGPDTLLNNPTFRSVLLDGLQTSGQYDQTTDRFLTVDSARRETAGIVTRNKTTGAMFYLPVNITSSTPCSFEGNFAVPATDTLIAMWHTHPFRPGGTWGSAERLPANCGRGSGVAYDPRPSDDAGGDWSAAVQKKVPYYAIDSKYVHVAPGNDPQAADSTKWRKLNRRYDWNTNKCRW